MINWGVRFKNNVFYVQMILAIFAPLLAYTGMQLEDFTTWGKVGAVLLAAIKNPYVLFLMIVSAYNAVVDPTTKGVRDSMRAIRYKKPSE